MRKSLDRKPLSRPAQPSARGFPSEFCRSLPRAGPNTTLCRLRFAMLNLRLLGLCTALTLAAPSKGLTMTRGGTPQPASGAEAGNSQTLLLSLTKRVIKGAASVGLDEAATRIIGPTGWKFAKAMIEPVYASLAKRYPALSLWDT